MSERWARTRRLRRTNPWTRGRRRTTLTQINKVVLWTWISQVRLAIVLSDITFRAAQQWTWWIARLTWTTKRVWKYQFLPRNFSTTTKVRFPFVPFLSKNSSQRYFLFVTLSSDWKKHFILLSSHVNFLINVYKNLTTTRRKTVLFRYLCSGVIFSAWHMHNGDWYFIPINSNPTRFSSFILWSFVNEWFELASGKSPLNLFPCNVSSIMCNGFSK